MLSGGQLDSVGGVVWLAWFKALRTRPSLNPEPARAAGYRHSLLCGIAPNLLQLQCRCRCRCLPLRAVTRLPQLVSCRLHFLSPFNQTSLIHSPTSLSPHFCTSAAPSRRRHLHQTTRHIGNYPHCAPYHQLFGSSSQVHAVIHAYLNTSCVFATNGHHPTVSTRSRHTQ